MTRFDYFSDIEDQFVRLRGKSLILGPLDWELIEQWKTDGVPLHVVFAAIEEVFKSHAARKARRPIGSLSYCKPEVEARFAEWKESRVGAHETTGGSKQEAEGRNPFPKNVVLAYLDKCLLAITEALLSTVDPQPPVDTLNSAHDQLNELRQAFEEQPNARRLEDGLAKIERDVDAAIVETASPEQIAEARAAAEALFGPYKGKMPEKVYEQQIDNHLRKHLRQIFGVPRLSLFHMKGLTK